LAKKKKNGIARGADKICIMWWKYGIQALRINDFTGAGWKK
jgi:hypothetical protein